MMASQYEGTPLESEWEKLERKKAINKALLQQALAPYRGTQSIGSGRFNFAVDDRLGQGVSKIGNALMARYQNRGIEDENQALGDKYSTERQKAIESITNKMQGAPEKPYNLSPDEQFDGEQIPGLKTAAVEPDRQGAVMEAATNPYLKDTKVAEAILGMQPKQKQQSYKIIQEGAGNGLVRDVEVVNGVRTKYLTQPYRKSMPSTNVNQTVNTGGDINAITKKANEKYGTGVGTRVDDRMTQATEAVQQNAALDRVLLAISRGAETGFGQEFMLDAKSLAKTMGFEIGDTENMAEQEVIRKVSNELALRLRNPESGLGLTGNTSNQDLAFLKASVVGLARTPNGNKKIIELMKKQNKLKSDVANEQLRIISANGGAIPVDMDKQVMDYLNQYQFFDEGERAEIEALLAEAPIETSNADIPPAPEGIDSEDWKYMDEADRALFAPGN